MRKGTTALQGVRFLKWARELGLHVVWNLLWGVPGEDPAEYGRIAGLVPLLTHLQPPAHGRRAASGPVLAAVRGPRGIRAQATCTPCRPTGTSSDLPQEALDGWRTSSASPARAPSRSPSTRRRLAEAVAGLEGDVRAQRPVVRGRRRAPAARRPDAQASPPRTCTVLSGAHRAAYLAADGVATAAQLRRMPRARPRAASRRGRAAGRARTAARAGPHGPRGRPLPQSRGAGAPPAGLTRPAPAGPSRSRPGPASVTAPSSPRRW